MNQHLYPIKYVLLVLKLALQSKCLNFNDESIFRESYYEMPFLALQQYIKTIQLKQAPKKSLPIFIKQYNEFVERKYNKLIKHHNSSKMTLIELEEEFADNLKTLSLTDTKEKIILTEEKEKKDPQLDFIIDFINKFSIDHNLHDQKTLQPITSHEFCKLVKDVMQNGCIIPFDNFEAYAAWLILFDVLDTLFNTQQNSPKSFDMHYKTDFFQEKFTSFLTTLCASNNKKTAEGIHNFLHLCYRVTQHETQNTMDIPGISKMMSVCLLSGLELEGKMQNVVTKTKRPTTATIEKKGFLGMTKTTTVIMPEDSCQTETHKQESAFASIIINRLLNCDQFSQPFSSDTYPSYLKNEQYEKVLSNLKKEVFSKLWNTPDRSLIPVVDSINIFESPRISPNVSPRIHSNSSAIASADTSPNLSPTTIIRHPHRKMSANSSNIYHNNYNSSPCITISCPENNLHIGTKKHLPLDMEKLSQYRNARHHNDNNQTEQPTTNDSYELVQRKNVPEKQKTLLFKRKSLNHVNTNNTTSTTTTTTTTTTTKMINDNKFNKTF